MTGYELRSIRGMVGTQTRIYHLAMSATSRSQPVEGFAELVREIPLRCVRVPDPMAMVRDVVIHATGDPAPRTDTVVLWAEPGDSVPQSVGVIVRESELDAVLPRLAENTAVFTAPDGIRWSDLYDRLRAAPDAGSAPSLVDDPFELADTLAISLGGAVSIEDAERRIVGFSAVPGQWIDDVRREGILGRKVPEHSERAEWYAHLWREPGLVEFRAGAESTSRVAIAVRLGLQPLGSIWVVGSREELNPDAGPILESARSVVAACLAAQDQPAARSRESRAKTLRQLLAGSLDEDVPPPRGPTVLVAVTRGGDQDDRELLDARLSDVLSMRAQRVHGSGVAAVIEGRVYALLPRSERTQLEKELRRILPRADFVSGRVAVSAPVTDTSSLPRARRHVDLLLGLNDVNEEPGIHFSYIDEELSRVWLAEITEAVDGLEAMTDGIVSTMVEHDERHATDYVASLRAWFAACGDVPTAAANMHVHPNTFRYRLGRVSEIFGLRLDDADERLLLDLQLRMRRDP